MRLPRIITQHFVRDADDPELTSPSAVSASRDNPFLTARTEFMNAFGDLAVGKRNWQLIAFALMGLLSLVTIAYVRVAHAPGVVPYIVQVDRVGRVAQVGPADALRRPEDRLIASELAQFVRAIRTVLPAAAQAAEAELLQRGYAFAAPQAAAFLNDYFADPKHDPRVLGQRLSRQVEVAAVLRVPKSDVWRLEWTETERSSEPAGVTRTAAWEGYVTVRLVPPASAATIQQNPLGLFITSVSWTELGETTAAGAAGGPGAAGPTPDPATPGAWDTTLFRGAKP
jgi:type IV secretion system protein TrbF